MAMTRVKYVEASDLRGSHSEGWFEIGPEFAALKPCNAVRGLVESMGYSLLVTYPDHYFYYDIYKTTDFTNPRLKSQVACFHFQPRHFCPSFALQSLNDHMVPLRGLVGKLIIRVVIDSEVLSPFYGKLVR